MSSFLPASRRTLALGAVLLGLALGGCGSAERGEARLGGKAVEVAAPIPERALKDTPFERSWDLQLPHRIHTSWISPNVPDLVFFQTEVDNIVYAVDTMSGSTRWVSAPLPKAMTLPAYVQRVVQRGEKKGVPGAGATTYDDYVYILSEDTLYVLDCVYGQLVWRHELGFTPSTGPVALGAGSEVRVFIGDWSGRLRVASILKEKGYPYERWQWNLGATLSAQPTSMQEQVYVTDHGGKLRSFKLDREEPWIFDAGAAIHGGALPRNNQLYLGNDDNIFFALNRLSGEHRGQLNLNGPIKRTPFAFRSEPQRVYAWVTHPDPKVGGLYAIRTQPDNIAYTDQQRHPLEVVRLSLDWFQPEVDRLVCSTPDHLYLTKTGSSEVLALNRHSGQYEWRWNLAEEHLKTGGLDHLIEYQDASDLNRSLYTADRSGHVIAYRLFGYKPSDVVQRQQVRADELAAAGERAAKGTPKAEKPAADKPAAEAAPAAEKPADAPAPAAPAAEKPAK